MIMHGIFVICTVLLSVLLGMVTAVMGTTAPINAFAEALQFVEPYILRAIRISQYLVPQSVWSGLVTFTVNYITVYITLSLIWAVVKLWRGSE